MRRLLLVLPVLLGVAPSAAAQGAIEVRACVEDADDRAPLQGAWVRAREGDGPAATGTTGADGCAWLTVPIVVRADETPGERGGIVAGPAYPNPTPREARVPVRLGHAQTIEWRLYDLLGRLVRGPVPIALPAGSHTLTLALDGLSDGRYVYRIAGRDGIAVGTVVKATTAGGATIPPSALSAATTLTFEAWRVGYDTLRTEREVEPGGTVVLPLVKMRGPGRPLMDMSPGETYLGFEGGLYPGSVSVPPVRHDSAGVARGRAVEPLDLAGNPSPTGRYVLLSIGMSNTTQEFCGGGMSGGPPCQPWSFVGQALADPEVNRTTLALADGARGGQTAAAWVSPTGAEYNRIRDQVLAPKGLSEAQVQVVWVKVANAGPTTSLPAAQADAYRLVTQQGSILRALRVRYPNLRQVFFSSRIWAGYAATPLNPEPYAYESGYAVKWTVGAQIAQMDGGGVDPRAGDLDYTTVAPWAAWGPYLWGEGLNPRSDGLVWLPGDFAADGTHPSQAGQQKVGALLLAFFKTSPYTRCWFVVGGTCGE